MEIKRCTRAEYQAFLDMANDAFSYGAENKWFQKHYGHCTPEPDFATDAEMANHFIGIIDGQIAGAVGAYPFEWAIAGLHPGAQVNLHAYGIGQVCCRSEYRNRGVMTALLTAAEKAMRENGAILGFLTGDRVRYGRFGYDIGGNTVKYYINKQRFNAHCDGKAADGTEALITRRATISDWAELNAAYNGLPSRVLRDERAWVRQLHRDNFQWHCGVLNGPKGYMAYQKPGEIAEAYGDPLTVAAMLREHMSRHALDGVTVFYPLINGRPDALGRMLHDQAGWVEVVPPGLFTVPDARAFLEKISPLLAACSGTAGFINDIYCLSDEARLALARRLAGYAHRPLPESLAGFEAVTPLNLWISEADFI